MFNTVPDRLTRPMDPSEVRNGASTPGLGVWDGVSIIIGIVIGVTIFKAPPLIFANVSGPWQGLAVWVLGGALSLIGALCYAELASTYPRSGGDYVYLTRAYGPMVGFLFGWAQLSAILTGSIGAMAYVFSDYAVAFWQADSSEIYAGSAHGAWLAAGAVAILTLMNGFGVLLSKRTQNLLTLTKVLGLAAILVAGVLSSGSGVPAVAQPMSGPGFGFAMIFVLYAYGGWNDAAFVAADVRDPQRNIVRVLLLGTASIAAVYVLINAAFLAGLGFEGVRSSSAPATDILEPILGGWGARGMGLLVMASALGAINGLIFTGSRIYTSVGADHRLFARLGHWHPRLGAPIWSLATQATFALSMILVVGTQSGQDLLDSWMTRVGLAPLPWDEFGGGFDTLVAATAPVFWSFFLLTGISLFVLRVKDRSVERPFSVPLYPIVPCLFCLTSVYMLWSAVAYARELSLIGIGPVLIGIPLYAFSSRGGRA
jgi:amino acid transporter